MLISVDFWKSIYGYAMDPRTREPHPTKAQQQINTVDFSLSDVMKD